MLPRNYFASCYLLTIFDEIRHIMLTIHAICGKIDNGILHEMMF